AAVLVPSAILVGAALLIPARWPVLRVGAIAAADVPHVLALAFASLAALGATLSRGHLAFALALSSVGYSLTAVYALFEAPDVAIVAVLIESLLTLLLVGLLTLFPREMLRREARVPNRRRAAWAEPWLAVVSGIAAFVVTWNVLSRPAADDSVAVALTRLTPEAHAGDVVSAIVADFRGLDTLGEITVVAIALVGITTLLARRRG
ncbi:MAG: hydrogen gas-evolving membrane-bound hydrogenase subunit E, partial [Candidatus Rokuibacteriota bacterium]